VPEKLGGRPENTAAGHLEDAEQCECDSRELLSLAHKQACPAACRHRSFHELRERVRTDESRLNSDPGKLLNWAGMANQETAGQRIGSGLLDRGVLAQKADDLLEEGRVSAPIRKP
jgi:hypothetical protein